MQLNNTCVACGAEFSSQQSTRCLRCMLKNFAGADTKVRPKVERAGQILQATVPLPPNPTSQASPPSGGSNTSQGTSKAFLAWQAKQSQRALPTAPKPVIVQQRTKYPTGSSPWRPPRIVSMPLGSVCALCGNRVSNMLQHKYEVHGEEPVVRSPATARKVRRWVTIVSGGLPSLGKRSR